MQSIPETNQEQTIFSYEESTQLVSNYILSRKDAIFDSRNIKLALVAQDPIGEVFKVKAFHRCQVNNLLRSQLIPVNNGGSPEIETVKYNRSPGVSAIIKKITEPTASKENKGSHYEVHRDVMDCRNSAKHQKIFTYPIDTRGKLSLERNSGDERR